MSLNYDDIVSESSHSEDLEQEENEHVSEMDIIPVDTDTKKE